MDNEQQGDIEVATLEAGLDEIFNQAVCELTPKHPVVYDAYNLCELTSQKKLSNFSIAVLKDICNSSDINLPDVTGARSPPSKNFSRFERNAHVSIEEWVAKPMLFNFSNKTFI